MHDRDGRQGRGLKAEPPFPAWLQELSSKPGREPGLIAIRGVGCGSRPHLTKQEYAS
jgi:hypothetical protein